jgi:hypothetical protein
MKLPCSRPDLVSEPLRGSPARRFAARLPVLGCAVLVSVGCAHRPALPITVIVDGTAAQVATVSASLSPDAVAELALRLAAVAPAENPDLGATTVASAFQDFIAGDGSRCRERLAAVDLARLLAHRQRTVVARALLLDARCAEGLGNSAAADARFEEFASYELELAEAGGVLSPTLRSRFDRALAQVGTAPRMRVHIEGPVGGRLLVDGKPAGCALPCSQRLGRGPHVVAVEADGFALAWRKLMVEAATTVALPQTPATAEEATQQWHARVGNGFAPDDLVGLGLLHRLAKDDRTVYLRVTSTAPGGTSASAGLTGALLVRRLGQGLGQETTVAARGHRLGLAAAPELVRQLAIDGKILRSPRPRWFWPVLVGSALASALVTAAILYQPETRTQLEF